MSFELQFKVVVMLRTTGLIPNDQTMSESYELFPTSTLRDAPPLSHTHLFESHECIFLHKL